MDHVRPDDKTATLGLDQGFRPLHVKRVTLESGHAALQTQWRPNAEQLAELNAGGVVVLHVLGEHHPAVDMSVWLPDGASTRHTPSDQQQRSAPLNEGRAS